MSKDEKGFQRKIEFPEKISKIVCGENHSLALSKNGNVFGFGFNHFHQLSNDEIYRMKIIGLNKPTLILRDKFGNLNVLDISASRNCSFFMCKDSTGAYIFYSAGEGLRGQLGQNVIKHMSDVEVMPDISGLINSETMKPLKIHVGIITVCFFLRIRELFMFGEIMNMEN